MDSLAYITSYASLLGFSFSVVYFQIATVESKCDDGADVLQHEENLLTGFFSVGNALLTLTRLKRFLPTVIFLNWIALAPAVFSVSALTQVPFYSSLASFAFSNYLALLMFLSGFLNCTSLFNSYIVFVEKFWFFMFAVSLLICVLGGMICGLSRSDKLEIAGTQVKFRKRRQRRLCNPFAATHEEKEFTVDVETFENEMALFMRLSSPTLSFPSRLPDPSYLTKLPQFRFPGRISEMASCSSATSDYDSSFDDNGLLLLQSNYIGAEECPICLEAYQPGEEVTKLSCFHHFHVHCIMAWIVGQEKHRCPICRWPTFIEKKHFYTILASHNAS